VITIVTESVDCGCDSRVGPGMETGPEMETGQGVDTGPGMETAPGMSSGSAAWGKRIVIRPKAVIIPKLQTIILIFPWNST